ncbi:MAG TPA: histidinol-phosphate transaminase [Nitrososphaerales archaeon]|nr:histidinol-phosphate transaminase [Nitrososphaerales archaeon]
MKTRRMFSKFEPYSWETSTTEIASAMRLRSSKIIRMDTNTSPYLPRDSLRALSKEATKMRVNDYPDTSYLGVRRELSNYCELGIENFVVTNGADEALDIITKTLLDPGDEVLVPSPSYSMFRVASELMGAKTIIVPRKEDFRIDTEKIESKISKKTKIIFLCSPNNPTGNSSSLKEVKSLLNMQGNKTIVIDEAYFEFSGKTFAKLASEHDDLLVVRTFSKAFSMAGVRVGYIIASKKNINKLNLVRPPNSVGVISLFLAQNALKDKASMNKNVRAIVAEREKMIRILRREDKVKVFPSQANFVLFRPTNGHSQKLHGLLMKKGFVLRNFSDYLGIEGCLRVTVNTPKVNVSFLNQLSQELHSLD